MARDLLAELPVDGDHGKRHSVRLCGVSASGLEDRDGPRQLTLTEPERRRGEQLGDALDLIEARFGQGAIRRAVNQPERDRKRDE